MRIQHNIMAMSSYRNYTNNVSAMKSNLEKLSSGYKINRAGDDAAGLAISEKMRAQITGLKQAQANAKSGINLVQTAEGALQEVQDMLNRMVKLAEQSANGTYDDDVDRDQLQKEFNRLTEEIDRINQSANFNGKALFGGPEAATKTSLNNGIETYEDTAKKPAVTVTPGKAAGSGSFAADTENKKTGQTADQASSVDLSGSVADVSGLKGSITVGELSVDLSSLDVSDGDAGSAIISKIEAAIQSAATAHNTSGAGNTSDYKKYENISVAAKSNTGYTVTYDETPQKYSAGGSATAAKVDVDFAGLTGKDVIGDKVTIGDKTYEFVKTGGTAASGNTAVAVAEDANAATLTSAFKTAVDGARPNGTTVSTSGTTVTVATTATGASATLTGSVEDAGGSEEDEVTTVASDAITFTGIDVTDKAAAVTTEKLPASFANNAEAIKVNDDISVSLAGIGATWNAAANKTVDDLAKAMLDAAKGAVNKWNADNADKDYTYGNVRISTTADGANESDIVAQAAGNDLYILIDKQPKEATGDTTDFNFQVGDTNDTYNRIQISIKHIGSGDIVDDEGTALKDLSVADEDKAGAALKSLKGMVNYISDIRGDLGAAQNRLTHTINNLSVMEENIQDAESTIRDTDVADEMMAYTKNNILIQSAQAMLAQANQVPQGVLQLLQ